MKLTESVQISLISAASALLLLYFTFLTKIREKRLDREYEEEKELRKIQNEEHSLKIDVLGGLMRITLGVKILHIVRNIFEQTTTDRVMFFLAKNGKTDFKKINLILPYYKDERDTENEEMNYNELKIDSQYKSYFNEMERAGHIVLDVSKMPNQILKTIYNQKKIKHSLLVFIKREKMNQEDDLIIYCSFSKFNETPYTDFEVFVQKAAIDGSIKNLF